MGKRVKAARVSPIIDRRDVERLRAHFRTKYKYGGEYALLVTLGCNLGLRAGDLLNLKVGDVRDKTHLEIAEQKTGKIRRIFINGKARAAIDQWLDGFIFVTDDCAFFSGQKGYVLTVKALHRIIKSGCREIGLEGNYGTHTLRKTFAYHAYQYTKDIKAVKEIMNHSDVSVTKLYVEGLAGESGEAFQGSADEVCSILNL